MSTAMIIGWIALVASWIVPQFIKDKNTKYFVGAIIASFAAGVFLGDLIYTLIK